MSGKRNKKVFFILAIFSLLLMGLSASMALAVNTSYVHFEFRITSPNDQTYRQQKWTKSSYYLKSTSSSRPWYTATAWGQSYKAGRTGNIDVSGGVKYHVYSYHTYRLTNYLVERYGAGNNAYIMANSYGYGSSYGTWHAD
ncbi:MAG: hypothetical protein ABF483_02335 [Liquorilactobacillus nagelii]|uniref:hypothetical protein n=1 Tax=Liquorilactobacillus nagelii TaxID=82688 RepID=UPI0039EA95C9